MRSTLFITLLLTSLAVSADNVINYPQRAQKLRIDGEVNVLYDVNEKGKTENIRVINAFPRYVFDHNVQKQISEWDYPEGKPQRDIHLRVIFKAN